MASRVTGSFYDGQTSARHQAWAEIAAGAPLQIHVEGRTLDYAPTAVTPSARLGNTLRRLVLPEGAVFETTDNDAIDVWLAAERPRSSAAWLHRLESRVGYVLVALGLIAAIGWAGAIYGLPALARHIAFAIPAEAEHGLGNDVLAAFEHLVRPSKLRTERQTALRSQFAAVAAGRSQDRPPRIEFRAGGAAIGANAFALPGGIVVFTDELVALAKHDEEILAVFAHELGHLEHRHTLRHWLQGSIAAVLLMALTGDASSFTSLASAAPAVLLDAHYSQDFEREADAFSIEVLRRQGVSPQRYADILTRLEADTGGGAEVPSFLSGHPPTAERVEAARRAADP